MKLAKEKRFYCLYIKDEYELMVTLSVAIYNYTYVEGIISSRTMRELVFRHVATPTEKFSRLTFVQVIGMCITTLKLFISNSFLSRVIVFVHCFLSRWLQLLLL